MNDADVSIPLLLSGGLYLLIDYFLKLEEWRS